MPTKSRFLSIYMILFALLVSVAIGAVTVSAQAPVSLTGTPAQTATKTNVPSQQGATTTPTSTVPAATKTNVPASPTSAASATRTSTTAPAKITATATATAPATKAPITSTVTRTPTKAASATATRTPTKAALAPRSVKSGPSGTYASTIACVNMSGSAATISLTFYPADSGTAALSYTDPSTLSAGSARSYFTPSSFPTLTNPFVGSAVASSDQQLACTVTTQRNDGGIGAVGTPARIGGAEGVSSGSTGTTLYVPQLTHAYSGSGFDWRSYLSVQNAEASTITVTVAYIDRFGVPYPSANETVTIPAQTNHVFYQEDNASLPVNFIGGATVTNNTSGKMAATASFYNYATDNTTSQLLSYTAFSSGANKWFVPRFERNYYGFNSGITVQNVGGSATTVTITFTVGAVNYVYTSGAIAAGANIALYAPNLTVLNPMDSLTTSARFGSAVIQAAPSGQVVAIVNDDNRGSCGSASCPPISATAIGWGTTYEAFPDGAQTNTVYIVQVPRHVSVLSGDFSGGYQVSNTTGSAGTCDITYANTPAATRLGVVLPANGYIQDYLPNVANVPDGFNNSVKFVCTQPVFGIANFAARSSSYYGDTFMTVIAVNQ